MKVNALVPLQPEYCIPFSGGDIELMKAQRYIGHITAQNKSTKIFSLILIFFSHAAENKHRIIHDQQGKGKKKSVENKPATTIHRSELGNELRG